MLTWGYDAFYVSLLNLLIDLQWLLPQHQDAHPHVEGDTLIPTFSGMIPVKMACSLSTRISTSRMMMLLTYNRTSIFYILYERRAEDLLTHQIVQPHLEA
jgi:hypothetical protein